MEYLKGAFPKYRKNKKWLKDRQNKTFGVWVQNRVSTLMEEQIYACCLCLFTIDHFFFLVGSATTW